MKALRAGSQALLLSMTLATAQPALALSDAERAGARAAASDGDEAFRQRRWTETIDLFRRAEAIVHSPVHLLYIAKAQIELVQLIEAQESLIKIANEEIPPTAPPAFREAQQEAGQLLEAVEPRLARISVTVQGESPSPVTVKMDGEEVPPTLVGVPRPVNPGEHMFVASSAGMESKPTAVTVGEGAKETVVLTLMPSGDGGSDAADPSTAAPATEEDTGPSGGMSGMKIGGFVGLGVGVVGLGLGTAFLIMGSGTQSDADAVGDQCDADPACNDSSPLAQEFGKLADDAAGQRTIGAIGLVVGGIGVAAGVTLLVLSGSEGDSARAPAVVPYVGYGDVGVVGRF